MSQPFPPTCLPKRSEWVYPHRGFIEMFLAALFVINKNQKQPACLSTDWWVNNLCYIYISLYVYYIYIKNTLYYIYISKRGIYIYIYFIICINIYIHTYSEILLIRYI